MLADPQFRARQSITTVEHPVLGPVAMQNVFPRLSRTPGRIRWPGPELGAHTADVLAEIGIHAATLEHLRAGGLV
jgi:formyl-CoA transferase